MLDLVCVYGFGWYGKMFFNFCKKCNIEAKIIDDTASIDEKYAETIDSIDISKYGVFIVCVGNHDIAKRIEDKLVSIGVESENIKIFAYDFYIPHSVAHKYATEIKYDFVSFLKKDTKFLDNLKSKIIEMKDYYYKDREKESQEHNIFQRMLPDVDPKGIMYPYFFTSKADVNSEFGFRVPIDIEEAAKSGKRIICFLGNCVSFGGDFDIEQSIPVYLERQLQSIDKDIVVINCSVYGATIGEQMSYYIWILRLLKPELVISFFGYELLSVFTSCEKMLSKYNFFYHTFVEKINKDYMHSDVPLYGETFRHNPLVNQNDAVKAIAYRLEQFGHIVNGDKTKFLSVLQPFFCKKLNKTSSENAIFEESRLTVVGGIWDLLQNDFESIVDKFVASQKNNPSFFDLNDGFSSSDGDIFRGWLALTADGNELASKLIAKKVEYVMFGK